jgi:transposase
MMGPGNPQRGLFYQLSVESFVPAEHPLHAIRPLIDDAAIRRACRDLYAPIGRPSIPPEQLFLALVGGYLLGVNSERKLVMELQCNMALRWFVGLNLDQDAWDASTFSQNRRRRFDESCVLDNLFDATIKQAMAAGLLNAAFVVAASAPLTLSKASGPPESRASSAPWASGGVIASLRGRSQTATNRRPRPGCRRPNSRAQWRPAWAAAHRASAASRA